MSCLSVDREMIHISLGADHRFRHYRKVTPNHGQGKDFGTLSTLFRHGGGGRREGGGRGGDVFPKRSENGLSTFSIFGEFDFSQSREKASTISNLGRPRFAVFSLYSI